MRDRAVGFLFAQPGTAPNSGRNQRGVRKNQNGDCRFKSGLGLRKPQSKRQFYLMPLPADTYSLCEAVADLAWNYHYYVQREEAPMPPDSRSVISDCIEWAVEFEKLHEGRVWDGEYIEEIDNFIRVKLQLPITTSQ